MTTKNDEIKEINLTEFTTIDSLDLSGGFTCDVETGICGPIEEKTEENIKENKNEHNDMV